MENKVSGVRCSVFGTGAGPSPTTYHLIQVYVPDRSGGVALGLFEELFELPVQDLFLGFLGFDRGRELLLPFGVPALHGAHRFVHGSELAGSLRRLVIDDRFQVRVDLEAGVAARAEDLEIHGRSVVESTVDSRQSRARITTPCAAGALGAHGGPGGLRN